MAKQRRLARTAVLTAAALLLPLSGIPAASATDPAAGPTAFTGTVLLPDSETVAKGAAVDLSLAGAKPFARGVSGLDGTFTVDVPETGELVTLALASGSSISVRWTASDLYPASSVPQPQVSTQAVLGTVHTSPGFGQVTGEFVAYLIDTTTNALANALSDPTMVEFHLPYVAGTGPLVTRVADLVHAAGIYQDPDMIEGNEDLDDPDVVPPLFAELDVYQVTDADLHNAALPSLGDPPRMAGNEGCTNVETWQVPGRGTKHMRGTKSDATLQLRRCPEDDGAKGYWAWAWEGAATPVDTPEEYLTIWRYKLRTELASRRGYDFSGYTWHDTEPRQDKSAGGSYTVTWSVGFEDGVTVAASGNYDVIKAKKTHPWQDYGSRKLYHVSWMSNSRSGSRGGWFQNGGGMAFLTPNAEQQIRVRTASNTFYLWRCWWPKGDSDNLRMYSCDNKE